jgi:RsiW-degrading membrane proteinase PrsW (M82 family)
MLLFAWALYWLDRFEKEPKILLGGVFLWGAIVAAGAAFVVNTGLGFGVYALTGSEAAAQLATGSLIAPVVEEILKGLAVMIVFIAARSEFDSLLDGVIYAGVAALGFAAAENTLYIYRDGFLEYGYAGLLGMVFVRVVLVGWQHPFYTAFFGIGLATARLSRPTWQRILAPATGLTAAIFLHGFHNLLSQMLQGLGGLAVSSLVDWSGWFVMFLFILWAIRREQDWIVCHLSEEVTLGALTRAQYDTACSAWRQSTARLGALFNGRFLPTSRFYQVCAELAYKKHQLAILGEEGGNSQIIQNLRAELSRLSASALH